MLQISEENQWCVFAEAATRATGPQVVASMGLKAVKARKITTAFHKLHEGPRLHQSARAATPAARAATPAEVRRTQRVAPTVCSVRV